MLISAFLQEFLVQSVESADETEGDTYSSGKNEADPGWWGMAWGAAGSHHYCLRVSTPNFVWSRLAKQAGTGGSVR